MSCPTLLLLHLNRHTHTLLSAAAHHLSFLSLYSLPLFSLPVSYVKEEEEYNSI
jgi:hypothetical protein